MTSVPTISPTPAKPTTVTPKQQPKTQLSIRDILLPQTVLLLAGGGHSAKTYFDNRGKAVVYEDMVKVFAEGSAERKGLEDCLKLAKKNMQDAKKGGIILLTTIALTTAWMLVAHACSKPKSNVENKSETVKEDAPAKVIANV